MDDFAQTIKTLLDLGTSGILLYFVYQLWSDRKERDNKNGLIIEKKDNDLKELNGKMLDVIKANTEVQSQLRGAVDANTRSNDTLTQKIYDVLSGK